MKDRGWAVAVGRSEDFDYYDFEDPDDSSERDLVEHDAAADLDDLRRDLQQEGQGRARYYR